MMINFTLIADAGDDLWSDHESQQVSAQIARFTTEEWRSLASAIATQGVVARTRIAQMLGDFNLESAADVLLPLAASCDREVALTARESLREMSFHVVAASAKRLAAEGKLAKARQTAFRSINEILDFIEPKESGAGAA
jgi:hypothetical protein